MNREHFPPTLPLADLVASEGVDGVHDLALACEAIEIAPKGNQAWRVTLLSQVVIGYERSAVVAGRDALAMDAVAAMLRAKAMPSDDPIQSRYRVLDLALAVRDVFARALTVADIQSWMPKYMETLLRVLDLDDTNELPSLFRSLLAHAPETARTLDIALAVYSQGYLDGRDDTISIDIDEEDESDADPFLPPDPPVNPKITKSA